MRDETTVGRMPPEGGETAAGPGIEATTEVSGAAPLEALTAAAGRLVEAVAERVVGQREPVEALVACYLAGGHALVEGVPGLGKTLLAHTFAAALGAEFRRVQFTPDLMPADVIGTNVLDTTADAGGVRFRLIKGPLFTHVLMADEINRTPPKTQSALLEAMEERQATIDGVTHRLDRGFFVVATQNPVEFEGIYPLPEAQLDRFLMRIRMGPPGRRAELDVYRKALAGELPAWGGAHPEPVVSPAAALALRTATRRVHVGEELLDYLWRLADAVRSSPHLELGVSPRGALALLEAARAAALLDGRDYVIPDDLKRFLAACWAHRVILGAESELEGQSAAAILTRAADTVEVPHVRSP